MSAQRCLRCGAFAERYAQMRDTCMATFMELQTKESTRLARLTDEDKQVLRDIIQRSVGKAPCAVADFPADSIARLVEASCVSVFQGVVVARGVGP